MDDSTGITVRKATKKGRIAVILAISALCIIVLVLPRVYPPLHHPVLLMQLLLAEPPAFLPVPVDGVGPQNLSNTWGAPRSEDRHHEGIDILAPRNTQVRSATDGIVVKKGWNRLGGRRVLILGPGGYQHYYAHLEAYGDYDIGDAVAVGDVIGYVGDSGNAINTPTHLHYGIYRPSGDAMNPYPLLVTR